MTKYSKTHYPVCSTDQKFQVMHTWILLPGEQHSWVNKAKNLSLAVLPLWWLSSLSFSFYSQTSQIMPYLFKIHWALNTRWPNSRLNRRRWFFSCYKKPGWWLLLISPRGLTKSGRWHWGVSVIVMVLPTWLSGDWCSQKPLFSPPGSGASSRDYSPLPFS